MILDVKDRIRQKKPILKTEIDGREEEIYSFLSGLLNQYPSYNKCPEYILDSLRFLGNDYYARAIFEYAKLKSEISTLGNIVLIKGSDETIVSYMNYCIDSYKSSQEMGRHRWLSDIFDQFFRFCPNKFYLFESQIKIPNKTKDYDFIMAIEKHSNFFDKKTERKLFSFYEKERLRTHSTNFVFIDDIADFILKHQKGYYPSKTEKKIDDILSKNLKFYIRSDFEISSVGNIENKYIAKKIILRIGQTISNERRMRPFISELKRFSNISVDGFTDVALINTCKYIDVNDGIINHAIKTIKTKI